MRYTYLVSSLPTLYFGDPPPFTGEEFLFRLQGQMGDAKRAQVAAILRGGPVSGHPFSAAWQARETQLRNAVARARAAALGAESRSVQHPHAGYDMGVAQAVTDAFGKTDPLEREMALDRCRWHVADELARHEMFGLSAVLAFAVKLKILERWASLSEEEGRKKVEAFIDANTVVRNNSKPGAGA